MVWIAELVLLCLMTATSGNMMKPPNMADPSRDVTIMVTAGIF
jgi:hypothetical protein